MSGSVWRCGFAVATSRFQSFGLKAVAKTLSTYKGERVNPKHHFSFGTLLPTQHGILIISTVPTLMLMMTIHLEEPAAVLRSAVVRSGDAEAKRPMNL